MSELFTYGSVGGAAGNCCSYPESDPKRAGFGFTVVTLRG